MPSSAPQTTRQKAYRKGLWAEQLCAWYLRLQGYRILAMRYGSPVGEIDLIAKRARSLLFVEIKARHTRADALHAISTHQQRRISRAAEAFLSAHPPYMSLNLRFDVMAVSQRWRLHHIKNAFHATAGSSV